MLTHSIHLLKGLQYPSGLFAASRLDANTGYHLAWIRDNMYAALGFEAVRQFKEVVKTYHALLDIFKKHEYKIDWMITQPSPKHSWRYIHARYNPVNGEEIWEEWGNKQNDAIGAFLFKIGDLEAKGIRVIRNLEDLRIVQKLVNYLAAIEYWHDADNGMWEEAEDVHASSIGACVAGLKKVQMLVDVAPALIKKGEDALNKLLPNETATRDVDLSLLSLIYPYNIVSKEQRSMILKNVENMLVRERGVLRYVDDKYYNNGLGEAEWTMGFCWLAIIYKQLNVPNKYAFYMRKAAEAMTPRGELPELYYANTNLHNDNYPLSWAQSLYVVASTI